MLYRKRHCVFFKKFGQHNITFYKPLKRDYYYYQGTQIHFSEKGLIHYSTYTLHKSMFRKFVYGIK